MLKHTNTQSIIYVTTAGCNDILIHVVPSGLAHNLTCWTLKPCKCYSSKCGIVNQVIVGTESDTLTYISYGDIIVCHYTSVYINLHTATPVYILINLVPVCSAYVIQLL